MVGRISTPILYLQKQLPYKQYSKKNCEGDYVVLFQVPGSATPDCIIFNAFFSHVLHKGHLNHFHHIQLYHFSLISDLNNVSLVKEQ